MRSGRLGLSLGLDLLGDAICSFDCVYCEVGPTRRLTLERGAWVRSRDILEELSRWRATVGCGPAGLPDVVTLGGQGEPCLNSELGAVIAGVRGILPDTPVAVLTNSAHLVDPEVRRALAGADLVLPSLDTLVPREMARLNRPHPGLTPGALAEGLLAFRAEFSGRVFLEVLLAAGYNDSAENLAQLGEFAPRLAPDRVDVVTLTRPGTLPGVRPVEGATLDAWRAALGAQAGPEPTRIRHQRVQAEAKSPFENAPLGGEPAAAAADPARVLGMVLASASRRPQTAEQLAAALGLALPAVRVAIEALVRQGRLIERRQEGGAYFGPRGRE